MPNQPAHTDPKLREQLEKSWGKPVPSPQPAPSNPGVSV